jgi:NodT family efflux transporter outer membrane factor (OMF) lipoprotein
MRLPLPHRIAASVAAGLMAACAAPLPQAVSPSAPLVAVPPAWTGAAGSATAPSLAAWWQRFNDPLLSRLVDEAVLHNTSVLDAQAALRQARALRDAAAAGALPQVSGSASVQRARSAGSTRNQFQAGLDASWEPDVFGGTRAAIDAAEATVGSRAARIGDVQVSISAELVLAYLDLRSAQSRLAIADANLASQQETLQIADWRQQAGLVTTLDVEQARGAVEALRAQRPALQTRIVQDAFAIAVLTGQAPATLLAPLSVPAALPRAPDELALSLPAETLRQRPDVRAAELDLAAALARVAQADAARYPSFRLGGSLGLSALTLGALTSSGALAAAVLGSVSIPIFDGGAARAQVGAQQAAWDQARAAYQASLLTALKEVEDALVALRGDRERLARLQQAASASTIAAELARQRYASGLVDFQVVLETQRSQLSTQDSVAGALADVSADHVRLFKALGGGWTPDSALTGATNDANASRS